MKKYLQKQIGATALVVLFVIFLVLVLTAASCPQQTMDPMEQLYVNNLATKRTCIDLLNRDRLSAQDGQDCVEVTSQASEFIRLYRATKVMDQSGLEAVNSALIKLENQLKAKQ